VLVSLIGEGRQRHGGELFRRVTPATYPLDQIKTIWRFNATAQWLRSLIGLCDLWSAIERIHD